ncbi:hypothetical protein BGZ49_006619 [Haplosporangium sp. Z 27]|nr:hypothetical protein BGZ49_006619 [Haplosporangium sp. Z 27]
MQRRNHRYATNTRSNQNHDARYPGTMEERKLESLIKEIESGLKPCPRWETFTSELEQQVRDLQAICKDMKKKGDKDPVAVLTRLTQFNKDVYQVYKSGFKTTQEFKVQAAKQKEPEDIQNLVQKFRQQCKELKLQGLEVVLQGIKSGLKTCPHWNTFIVTLKAFKGIWDSRENELRYEFNKESDEEIKKLPLDLRRFLPATSTENIDFTDSYDDLASYKGIDKSLWFLWLMNVLASRSGNASGEDLYWDYIKKMFHSIINVED